MQKRTKERRTHAWRTVLTLAPLGLVGWLCLWSPRPALAAVESGCCTYTGTSCSQASCGTSDGTSSCPPADTNCTLNFVGGSECSPVCGAATETPTQTSTQTPTQTATVTRTPTITPTGSRTATQTPTNTPTNSPTITPTRTLTPSQTVTGSPTNTPTVTQTPTITNTPTVTPTPSPKAPIITRGVIDDSRAVTGNGVPNGTPGNNCITIYNCGPNGICGDYDDQQIGQGSVDASGNFTIGVSPPLAPGERIYPVDTCNNLTGPVYTVQSATEAPLMSPALVLMLVATLGIVGLLGLAAARQR